MRLGATAGRNANRHRTYLEGTKLEISRQVALVVASPPYADQDKSYGDRPNRWAKVADNPNFRGRTHWRENDRPSDYGRTPGQLGNMKDNMKHTEKATVGEMPSDAWTGCYDGGWQGLIVAEAFAHP